jgi:hypothetical protein
LTVGIGGRLSIGSFAAGILIFFAMADRPHVLCCDPLSIALTVVASAGLPMLRGSTDRRQLINFFITQYPNSPLTSDVRERLAALDRGEKLLRRSGTRPG